MLGFCLAWACVCFVNAGSLCEFICASALPYGEQSFTEVSLCFQLLQSSCLLFHTDASGLRGGFDEDITVSWVFQCLFLFACCPVVGLCLSAQLRQEETSLARSEQDTDLPPFFLKRNFFCVSNLMTIVCTFTGFCIERSFCHLWYSANMISWTQENHHGDMAWGHDSMALDGLSLTQAPKKALHSHGYLYALKSCHLSLWWTVKSPPLHVCTGGRDWRPSLWRW